MQNKFNIRYFGRFLTIALGVAALVACEKVTEDGEDVWNPLTGDTPVRIRTSVTAPETKVTGTAFDNGDQIGIFGFYHNGSGNTDGSWAAETSAGTNVPDYMFNQRMTYNGSTSVWDYSPIKYWPNENGDGSAHKDKLSFWGYYPYGAAGLSFRAHDDDGSTAAYSNTTSGLPDLYFTQNANPASQVDLMVSDLRSDLYKNDTSLTDGEVELTFSHAMARVTFKVQKEVLTDNPKPEPDLENYTVSVTSIYLTKLHESAIYTPPSSGWSHWSSSLLNMTVFSGEKAVTSGAEPIGATILPIPQSLSEVALHVDYTLYTPSPGDLGGQTINQSQEFLISTTGTTEWEEGKQYVYTLTFHNQGLYLKVSAAPWDDVAARSETTVLESNLYIEDPTYLRYDIDGDFNSWTDSYAAVADGVADGKLRSPRLRLITTSPATELKLICDNDNFRFRKYNPGTGNYDAGVAELSIAAGTEVDTYFCVVPKDGTVPSEADACKANVYLTGASGLPYLPYNAGVFPGNASSTSCQFYIVSTSAYDATYEAPYTNFKPEDR